MNKAAAKFILSHQSNWLESFLLSRQKIATVLFGVIVLTLCLSKISLSLPVQFMVTALTVGSFGFMHGALDLELFFRGERRRSSYFCLMAIYISAAALVFFLWLWRPVIALILFLAITWWHFALEEFEDFESQSQSLNASMTHKLHLPVSIIDSFCRGGLIIFASLLADFDLTEKLFALITAGSQSALLGIVCSRLQFVGLLVVLLLPVPFFFDVFCNQRRVPISLWRLIESFMLLALFCLGGPLVGFSFYFCGTHSLKELARLVAVFGFVHSGTRGSGERIGLFGFDIFAQVIFVLRKCLPMTALAAFISIFIFLSFYLHPPNAETLSGAKILSQINADGHFYQSLLYCTFVSLSMLTFPHALLRLCS